MHVHGLEEMTEENRKFAVGLSDKKNEKNKSVTVTGNDQE